MLPRNPDLPSFGPTTFGRSIALLIYWKGENDAFYNEGADQNRGRGWIDMEPSRCPLYLRKADIPQTTPVISSALSVLVK
jgi:hypothetical protein